MTERKPQIEFRDLSSYRKPKVISFDLVLLYAAQPIPELQIPPSRQPERQGLFAWGIYCS